MNQIFSSSLRKAALDLLSAEKAAEHVKSNESTKDLRNESDRQLHNQIFTSFQLQFQLFSLLLYFVVISICYEAE